jgi:RNA polymerase sigma-70 factor (ECF subfamily)
MTESSVMPQPSLDCISDVDLVERIRAGEHALFELIMRRYNQRLFRVARGILRNSDEAEDAVQNGYIRAFQSLDQFKGPKGFGAWLSRIVSNEAFMTLRKHGSKVVPLNDERSSVDLGNEDHSIERRTPEHSLHERELQRLLEKAVDALPDTFRSTFVLREIEQLSVSETAEVLQIEPATVKTRVHRARQLLKQNVSHDLEDVLRSSFSFAGRDCDRMVRTVFKQLNLS